MTAAVVTSTGGFTPRSALLPLGILTLVVLMVVPIPPLLLDIFFTLNLGVALIVLMVAINTRTPLDFSAFPTVLLFATLLRLSLNVASTRVVLVGGHKGTAAAGHVIEAFGSFLIGGDYIVGIFVFAILMIINLVVITKGAGRVSEVAARFTLDAMPGKQMAIDADMNAGLLTADQARIRRAEVSTEADFHGSMDGASKFVKGDAVAGVMILFINIVGGLILGDVQHGLSLSVAAKTYILLAIGDGLVAQVPALLLSIAAAMIVTRVSSEHDLAGQISSQFASPAAWVPVAVILGLLGALPGMPHLVLLPAAAGAGVAAWALSRKRPEPPAPAAAPSDPASIAWEDVADNAQVGLDLGYGLIALVDEARGAPLMARITAIRRSLSKSLGFVVPVVRVRDDIALSPQTYRILIDGVVVGEDQAWPDDVLALEAGPIDVVVPGRAVKDPSFGLDARWIDPGETDLATAAGYTVVDAATVIGTHLNTLLADRAALLLGQDEVQKLLDGLAATAPQLVSGLVPKLLPLATVTQVLQRLVEEGVPIRDLRGAVAALAAVAARSPDAGELTELVRPALGGAIVQTLAGLREPLPAITLAPELEELLAASVRAAPGSGYPFDPALAGRVLDSLAEAGGRQANPVAIVTAPPVRRALFQLIRHRLPGTRVLSIFEIPDDRAIEVVATVGAADRPGSTDAADQPALPAPGA